jgi:hypothetical protein
MDHQLLVASRWCSNGWRVPTQCSQSVLVMLGTKEFTRRRAVVEPHIFFLQLVPLLLSTTRHHNHENIFLFSSHIHTCSNVHGGTSHAIGFPKCTLLSSVNKYQRKKKHEKNHNVT